MDVSDQVCLKCRVMNCIGDFDFALSYMLNIDEHIGPRMLVLLFKLVAS